MEQHNKTLDTLKTFEVRLLKFVPYRRHNEFKIHAARTYVTLDRLDDPKLDEQSLFAVKYPWHYQDLDVWGITELKKVLDKFKKMYIIDNMEGVEVTSFVDQ